MPAFRMNKDKIITFHDLEEPDGPLFLIVDENEIEILDVPTFLRDEELRKLVISINMALSMHLIRAGLEGDDGKQGRFSSQQRGANACNHMDSTQTKGDENGCEAGFAERQSHLLAAFGCICTNDF